MYFKFIYKIIEIYIWKYIMEKKNAENMSF